MPAAADDSTESESTDSDIEVMDGPPLLPGGRISLCEI